MDKQKTTVRHYLVIITCIAINLFVNAIAFNVAPTFYAPVTEELGVLRGTFGLYMTCIYIASTIVLPYVGKLVATKDLRVLLTIGTLCVAVPTFCMGLFTVVWQYYIAGLIIGIGEAFMLFASIPVIINRWFAEKAGFWLGLSMAFAGVGGFVFNLTTGAIIADMGWRTAYMVNGVIALLAIPFIIFCIRSFPSDCNLLPAGAVIGGASDSDSATPVAAEEVRGVTASVALRSPAFILIMVMTLFLVFAQVLYQYMASYASSLPIAETAVTIGASIASAAMLSQAIAKPILGIIADKIGALGALIVAVVLGIVGMVMFLLLGGSATSLIAAAFVFGWIYACSTVCIPLIVRQAFGSKDYAIINSRNAMIISLSAAFAATLWGYLVDFAGFQMMWICGIGVAVLSIVFAFAAIGASKKLKQTTASEDAQTA